MSITFQENVTLVTEHCYKCGVLFAMPAQMQEVCRRDKASFFCPNGHGQIYDTNSLREQIARLEIEVTRAKGEAMRERQMRETAEFSKRRLEKRVKRGVCPCCHRTLKQLAAHMKTKHPDYGK